MVGVLLLVLAVVFVVLVFVKVLSLLTGLGVALACVIAYVAFSAAGPEELWRR